MEIGVCSIRKSGLLVARKLEGKGSGIMLGVEELVLISGGFK